MAQRIKMYQACDTNTKGQLLSDKFIVVFNFDLEVKNKSYISFVV